MGLRAQVDDVPPDRRAKTLTTPERQSIAFIGLGLMGARIARNLISQEHVLYLYNRDLRKVDSLIADAPEGRVVGCRTAAEAAASASVVMSCLADGEAVRNIYWGRTGVFAGISKGALVVEMSTVSRGDALAVADAAHATDCEAVDAPVSGSTILAARRELTIMVGGAEAAFDRASGVLAKLGSRIHHVGPNGQGVALKLAINTVIYGLNQAIAEGLLLAERSGVARSTAYDVLASSAAAAPYVHYRRANFENPDSAEIAFSMRLALKDQDLIAGLAGDVGCTLAQAELNRSVVEDACNAGLADRDLACVAEFLRSNGLRASGDTDLPEAEAAVS